MVKRALSHDTEKDKERDLYIVYIHVCMHRSSRPFEVFGMNFQHVSAVPLFCQTNNIPRAFRRKRTELQGMKVFDFAAISGTVAKPEQTKKRSVRGTRAFGVTRYKSSYTKILDTID